MYPMYAYASHVQRAAHFFAASSCIRKRVSSFVRDALHRYERRLAQVRACTKEHTTDDARLAAASCGATSDASLRIRFYKIASQLLFGDDDAR